jgi:hypothetical protein
MPTLIVTNTINIDELQRAFATAPGLVHRNVKSELFRFARRVRRKVIRERMSGRPGIDGGQFRRGKHVQGFVTGNDLASLKAVNKISRILRVHEEGGVITAKGGGWLYLSRKTRVKGQGRIFARVKQVVIPARLGFEMVWRREAPDGVAKVASAMERAMREAVDRQFKAITRTVQRLVA